MKIRQGFVSNSSTTSFCIYGTRMSAPYDEQREDEFYDADDELCEKCDKLGLYCNSSPWDSEHWVGLEFTDMHDDETRKQFEARVEHMLFTHFGIKPKECGVYKEAWRDG